MAESAEKLLGIDLVWNLVKTTLCRGLEGGFMVNKYTGHVSPSVRHAPRLVLFPSILGKYEFKRVNCQ